MSQNMSSKPEEKTPASLAKRAGCSSFERWFKPAIVLIVVLVVGSILFQVARAAVYKIRPYERGLHLRGGRFIGVDQPGWHVRIPFVDTTIGITVNERPGKIDQLAAMTSDNVTMDISLLYTYRVSDPERYALEVANPDQIVAEFVKGKLLDVINTKSMEAVMQNRATINDELMEAIRTREAHYGVEFVMVQMQGASPPSEVLSAIKDRMVAVQLQQQADAEAAQRRTVADAEFYATQKQADGEAYQITKLAEADAERISLTTQAQQEAMEAILETLEGKGDLGGQYLQVLMTQELQENSKWIITGNDGITPMLDLRESPE